MEVGLNAEHRTPKFGVHALACFQNSLKAGIPKIERQRQPSDADY